MAIASWRSKIGTVRCTTEALGGHWSHPLPRCGGDDSGACDRSVVGTAADGAACGGGDGFVLWRRGATFDASGGAAHPCPVAWAAGPMPVAPDPPVPWDAGSGGESREAGGAPLPCCAPSQSFAYTGATQTYVVPDGVEAVLLKAWGAAGGGSSAGQPSGAQHLNPGGPGGYASGVVDVAAGDTLEIAVGGGGMYRANTLASGGWPNGGDAGGRIGFGYGGGGGRSHVSVVRGGASFDLLVAGGGGGAGGPTDFGFSGEDYHSLSSTAGNAPAVKAPALRGYGGTVDGDGCGANSGGYGSEAGSLKQGGIARPDKRLDASCDPNTCGGSCCGNAGGGGGDGWCGGSGGGVHAGGGGGSGYTHPALVRAAELLAVAYDAGCLDGGLGCPSSPVAPPRSGDDDYVAGVGVGYKPGTKPGKIGHEAGAGGDGLVVVVPVEAPSENSGESLSGEGSGGESGSGASCPAGQVWQPAPADAGGGRELAASGPCGDAGPGVALKLLAHGKKCADGASADLGTFASLKECADACREADGCAYFSYGDALHGDAATEGKCVHEQTEPCTREDAAYDYYAVCHAPRWLPFAVVNSTTKTDSMFYKARCAEFAKRYGITKFTPRDTIRMTSRNFGLDPFSNTVNHTVVDHFRLAVDADAVDLCTFLTRNGVEDTFDNEVAFRWSAGVLARSES